MAPLISNSPVTEIPRELKQKLADAFAEKKDLHILDEEDVEPIRHYLRKHPNARITVAQAKGQTDMLPTEADIAIVGGSRGGGKGMPYHYPVVTPFGMKPIGDLEVGSMITDIRGGMQKVICITELGNREVFRLKFSDGTYVDCTDDHLWKIKQTCHIHKTRKINGTGQEADWRLWTMRMIMDFLDTHPKVPGKQTSNLLVPLCEPVRFTKSFVHQYVPKTDAYVIGALLGDGCITESVINNGVDAKLTTPDKEIVDAFVQAGIDMSKFQQKPGNKAKDYRIKNDVLREDLEGLELYGCYSHTKFIPEYYKYAPLDIRWQFVRGLLDTDGTTDDRGHVSYTTTSKKLADDLAFILRSLGAYVTVTKHDSHYIKNGERIDAKDSYDLYIKMKDSERLFNLSRKKARCKPFNGGVSEPTKRIVGYEFVGYDKCRCIAVSDPSALYLTSDFTVTHNSYVLLMNALYDITDPNFRAIIFRKDLDDLTDIIDTSHELYDDYGTYNRAKNDMTWNFNNGGWLTFSYHNMEYEDFHDRYQGKQYPYIAIDEVTQMSYKKFKVLTMSNRSAYGIPTRIVGSCNPDPDSWVAKFIEWYIDQDTGLPIPERAGVIRYCCMLGDDVSQVSWGMTREECYEKNKAEIEAMWKPEYNEFGSPQDLFIRSATFIPAKLTDNHALMDNNPEYLGILFNQDEETKARFLDGNWKYKAAGDDIIKLEHMERFYDNAEQRGDGTSYVTCDAAFDGGDKCVFWLWIGNHVADVEACSKDSKATVAFARELLNRWRVREDHFAYDLLGIGHVFKGFFPKAVPFNAKEAVNERYKGMYFNLKAQCFTYFADHIKDGTYSIADYVLKKRFSGKNYSNKTVKELLNEERRCIRFREDDPTRCIDKGKGMKRIIHRSPDWIEAMTIREIFNIKQIHHKPKNLGLITGASEQQMRKFGVSNPFGGRVGRLPVGKNTRKNNVSQGFRW